MRKIRVQAKSLHSGIITLRTTSSTHHGLKVIARKEKVSLNHLVSNFLSQKVFDELGRKKARTRTA